MKYRNLNDDEVYESRLIKIPDKYMADYEELNEDPSNPNSAVLVVSQYDMKTFHT